MNGKLLGVTDKSTPEQLVYSLFTKMKVGDYILGETLDKINPKLSIAAKAIKKIERVESGLKVSLTWAGKVFMKTSSRYSIEDGAIFKLRLISVPKDTDKHSLEIKSSQATMDNNPFKVYINNNVFTLDYKDWYYVINPD